MSTFQPEGVKIELNGEERHLLWDFGVIEKVQEKYGGHPIVVIKSIFWEENGLRCYMAKPLLDIMEILLNNEVARDKYFNGSSSLKTYKRSELGFLINRENANVIVPAIVESWVGSNPDAETDEDEEDPEEETEEETPKNVKSGKRTQKR